VLPQQNQTPILLSLREADNNSGTLPIQSERFYDALKGESATVRLVLLPLEAHAYQGRERVLHVLWEMEDWLNKCVMPEQPVGPERSLLNEPAYSQAKYEQRDGFLRLLKRNIALKFGLAH